MFKRDRIFYIACSLTVIGIILAFMGKELGLLFGQSTGLQNLKAIV
jgi:hypothetical protein